MPRTAFVANFLGQSNLFTGRVSGTTAHSITVDVEGNAIVVPKARAARHTGDVTVGVRPEKLSLLFGENPAVSTGENQLGPGRVIDVSFSGVSTQYLVAVPGLSTITVFSQNTTFGPVVDVGTEVWVSWQIAHGFGLEDDAEPVSRFPADFDTATIAVQRKRALSSELKDT